VAAVVEEAVVVAAEAVEVAAVRGPAAADSRHKLRPGQPLGRLLGRLHQPLGPPRSLVLVRRRALARLPGLVPRRRLLGPQRVPLPLGPVPAMSRLGLGHRLAR
jgi:hypothetical protein